MGAKKSQNHEIKMILKKGWSLNPIRKYPRNCLCWCDSGQKAKRCCLPRAAEAIKTELVDEMKIFMKDKLSKAGR